MGRTVETTKSRLVWSGDGTQVTKQPLGDRRYPVLGSSRDALRNEIRINRMLSQDPPPVPVARLVSSSYRNRSITFDAVDGAPLGPKFPTALPERDVAAMVGLVRSLDPYRPRRRWHRRLDIGGRLRQHVGEGLLTEDEAERVLTHASRLRLGFRFAHGDVSARNVLREPDGRLVLIDWEWAGLYPAGYELAFLWFSLIDVAGGRDLVTRAVPARREGGFLLSALLIQLLHLHLWSGTASPYREAHEATLRDLLHRIS